VLISIIQCSDAIAVAEKPHDAVVNFDTIDTIEIYSGIAPFSMQQHGFLNFEGFFKNLCEPVAGQVACANVGI